MELISRIAHDRGQTIKLLSGYLCINDVKLKIDPFCTSFWDNITPIQFDGRFVHKKYYTALSRIIDRIPAESGCGPMDADAKHESFMSQINTNYSLTSELYAETNNWEEIFKYTHDGLLWISRYGNNKISLYYYCVVQSIMLDPCHSPKDLSVLYINQHSSSFTSLGNIDIDYYLREMMKNNVQNDIAIIISEYISPADLCTEMIRKSIEDNKK